MTDTDGLPGEAYPEPELPPCRECASAERVESIGRNKWWCGSCDIVWATSPYGDTHAEPAVCNDANPRNVTCPGRPVCPYVHCRKCGECPIVNGFGAFGHCAACLDGPPITTRVINREEYEAPLSRTDETPTETKTDD